MSFLRLFLLLCVVLSSAGCQSDIRRQGLFSPKYYRVRVTDPRGLLVADWISEGYVKRIEGGYRFRAVERLSAPPNMQRLEYPLGRIVDVSGPNIVIARCGQPLWLYERRQGYETTETTVTRSRLK